MCASRPIMSSSVNNPGMISQFPIRDRVCELWKNAVDEYIATSRISLNEKELLRRHAEPKDIFDLRKSGWENIEKKRWAHHATFVRTVAQVLGVFEVVNNAVGLASAV